MNKTWKNASWIIGCRVIQSLLSFVVSLMSARYLGPSNYGILQYATSLVAFVTPIMTLGFTNTLVHEFVSYKEHEGEILGTAIFSCVITAVLCIAGIVGFVFLTNPNDTSLVFVCSLYSLNLIFAAIELTQYWFYAHLQAKYTAIVSLIAYIGISTFRIFLLATGKNIYWFAASYVLDVMFIAIVLMMIYKRMEGQKLTFSFLRLKTMFANSRHYIVSSMMVSLMTQTDRIMLNHMLDSEATGYYSAAVACASITSFVFAAIADSFRPVIFESHMKDQTLFEDNLKKLYSIMIYMSLIQCLGIVVFSDLIVNLTYGEAYYRSADALPIVVWYTTFSYLGVVRNIWILAEHKQKYLGIINFSGAVMNIVLNYFLIPVLGINGAALASLITQFFANVVMGYILKPIRENNKLMFQALDPRILFEAIKNFRR